MIPQSLGTTTIEYKPFGCAVDKVAKQNNLAIVFDKAGELVMIYTDPRFDYTDFVLDELGLGDPNDKIKN